MRASTPEATAYWRRVDATAADVDAWPAWKRGEAEKPRITRARGDAKDLRDAVVVSAALGGEPYALVGERFGLSAAHVGAIVRSRTGMLRHRGYAQRSTGQVWKEVRT